MLKYLIGEVATKWTRFETRFETRLLREYEPPSIFDQICPHRKPAQNSAEQTSSRTLSTARH